MDTVTEAQMAIGMAVCQLHYPFCILQILIYCYRNLSLNSESIEIFLRFSNYIYVYVVVKMKVDIGRKVNTHCNPYFGSLVKIRCLFDLLYIFISSPDSKVGRFCF
jgi:hypothetical protein